jgi:hypothetical protein
MKSLIVLLFLFLFVGCQRTPEEKWYHHVLDSLGKIEAPKTIDTLLFKEQLNGRGKLDTIIDNVYIRKYCLNGHYILEHQHRDSAILNKYAYTLDGRLHEWSRYFKSSNSDFYRSEYIIDYKKIYKKNGKIDYFGGDDQGFKSVPWPKYTIYKLIERLQAEGIDVKKDIRISRRAPDPSRILEFDGITYLKMNWKVGVYHVDEIYPNGGTIHWREFDSDNGQLVREWNENWHYH